MGKPDDTQRAYGCAFCVTGKEWMAARHIERISEDIRVMVPRQAKRKTMQGKTHTEEAVLFPGYIFFNACESANIVPKFLQGNLISILRSDTGDWRLYGNDAKIAQWLFSYGGVVPFSKACQEGDRIRIVSGPLKDLEGLILRVVKRDRCAQVAVTFCNRIVKVWLGFEIVEKI